MHWTLHLELSNSHKFVVDLTGAQDGWKPDEMLLPVVSYYEERVKDFDESIPTQQACVTFYRRSQQSRDLRDLYAARVKCELRLLKAMEWALKEWLRREGLSMTDLLTLGEGYEVRAMK